MAISDDSSGIETPLLVEDIVDGCLDYKGRPVDRTSYGGWKSASFIIGVEIAERFAYCGIDSNLVTYLTGPLGQTGAVNVNAWSGTVALLPLLGAFIADSFLGRYRTIIVASLIYILQPYIVDGTELVGGLSHRGLGLLTLSATLPSLNTSWCQKADASILCSPQLQVIIFFSLYPVASGQGRHKPCVQAFDADQFDAQNQEEFKAKIQNWRTSSIAGDKEAYGTLPSAGSEQYKFLNKALLAPDGSKEHGKVCCIGEVEEAKAVLRLVPIWATSLVYAVAFINLTIVLSIPIYDCIFVPLGRAWTGKPAGITMLQRNGSGMFLSAISMALAALTEMKRIKIAQEHGLVDEPEAMVPMSVWWLVPQYVVTGLSEMLTMVGLQEFFYDQVPNELRSIGLALYLSIFGVGSLLSGILISSIDKATGGSGGDGWPGAAAPNQQAHHAEPTETIGGPLLQPIPTLAPHLLLPAVQDSHSCMPLQRPADFTAPSTTCFNGIHSQPNKRGERKIFEQGEFTAGNAIIDALFGRLAELQGREEIEVQPRSCRA
ncbi:Protein NRT1/ PTR FAMILY 5.10 [Hibiscus syriacus]|uniref:Protein NRT1/ PTR FAMILY 5.10 n=1 Tax=Hibiscus syriacus TaxID=106335 RepID=A0A6A2YYC8_HIBSY|nr:Protein NRT1/ PTR FAMILY 5.10 [Hibiscus syriacus]